MKVHATFCTQMKIMGTIIKFVFQWKIYIYIYIFFLMTVIFICLSFSIFSSKREPISRTRAKNKAEIFSMQHFFEHGSSLFRLGDCPLWAHDIERGESRERSRINYNELFFHAYDRLDGRCNINVADYAVDESREKRARYAGRLSRLYCLINRFWRC